MTSRRDVFAAAALQGLPLKDRWEHYQKDNGAPDWHAELVAGAAVRYADALLAKLGEEASPSGLLYHPGISIDGDKWCALYGDNLQDGVCGFGDSPAEAMADFDRNWYAKLGVTP